jgi:hypothetical protein
LAVLGGSAALNGEDCGVESKRLWLSEVMEVLRIGASSFPPCEAVGSVATCDVAVLEGGRSSDEEVSDTRRSSSLLNLLVD